MKFTSFLFSKEFTYFAIFMACLSGMVELLRHNWLSAPWPFVAAACMYSTHKFHMLLMQSFENFDKILEVAQKQRAQLDGEYQDREGLN